jgi:TRAP-type C4-dicarboxylate transport system substrate-binding protein
MNREFLAAAVAAVMLASFPAHAADPIVLKFSTASPPTSEVIVNVLVPWAEKINKDAGDLFKVQVFHGFAVANRTNAYERTMTDVIQIGYSGQNQTGGKFPQSDVVTLPFVSTNSESASAAFWKIYADGTLAKEYAEVQPLILGVFTKAMFHFNKKEVKTVDQLKGLKVRVSDRVGAEVTEALGAAAIQTGSTDTYKMLQSGTIDGVLTSWGAIVALKMSEVTTWHVESPLSASNAWVFMAKKKFDGLPEAARKVLMANSGAAMSRRFGAYHEELLAEARATLAKTPGHTIYQLPPAEAARWIRGTENVVDNFVKSTPDGAKVLAAYRAAFAEAEKQTKK